MLCRDAFLQLTYCQCRPCEEQVSQILDRNVQTWGTLEVQELLLVVEPLPEGPDNDVCPEVLPPICFRANFGDSVDFKMCLLVTFFSSTCRL